MSNQEIFNSVYDKLQFSGFPPEVSVKNLEHFNQGISGIDEPELFYIELNKTARFKADALNAIPKWLFNNKDFILELFYSIDLEPNVGFGECSRRTNPAANHQISDKFNKEYHYYHGYYRDFWDVDNEVIKFRKLVTKYIDDILKSDRDINLLSYAYDKIMFNEKYKDDPIFYVELNYFYPEFYDKFK